MDNTDNYISLSLLAQAGYCLRRAGLIINEAAWQDNAHTVKGSQEHQRVHTYRSEFRKDGITLYDYVVCSHKHELLGRCDCIEAIPSDCGCCVPGIPQPVTLNPVEYKHGRVRKEREYEIQLCAQAICLEEMFQTQIDKGDIFYVTSHRRETVRFTKELREETINTISIIQDMRRNLTVPPATYGAKCHGCSLQDLCLPMWKNSAKKYCAQIWDDTTGGTRE